MWPMGRLFIKTSPIKQFSYENDFSGVSDALGQSFLVLIYGVLLALELVKIAVNLIQSKEHHSICFRGFCPYNVHRRIHVFHVFLRRLSLTNITETDMILEKNIKQFV